MLNTRITELFQLDYPIMSAPMTNHCGGRLAAAVSQAGGLGSFGGINDGGPDWVRQQIAEFRGAADRPFAVGFITHLIPLLPDNFEAALEEKVPGYLLHHVNGTGRDAGKEVFSRPDLIATNIIGDEVVIAGVADRPAEGSAAVAFNLESSVAFIHL